MDKADIKETRRVLRIVQAHIADAHLRLGTEQESAGFVEVMTHPKSELPHLNYVTPRKNTAWIPAPEVQKGMEILRANNRPVRVNYIEGLFPPIFAKSLHQLGLVAASEDAIMVYKFEPDTMPELTPTPDSISVKQVADQEGIGIWWYVWSNAFFDVLTTGVEPIKLGHEFAKITEGHQVDLLLYRQSFPIGAARLTFHEKSAHLTTLAIMKESHTPALVKALYNAALRTAAKRGCELLFTCGDGEDERRFCRELGFVDSGSMVSYTEPDDSAKKDETGDNVAQLVFALR